MLFMRQETCMGRPEVGVKFRTEILKVGDHLRSLAVDGRMILKWTLKKYWARVLCVSSGSEQGPVARHTKNTTIVLGVPYETCDCLKS
jgi:hypothetical protein